MNAFAASMAIAQADPNVGRAATYQPNSGSPLALRVTLLAPDRVIDMGMVGSSMLVAVARIAIADVPLQPLEGDGLTIGSDYYEVTVARRDSQGVSWLLHLRDLTEQTARGRVVREAIR